MLCLISTIIRQAKSGAVYRDRIHNGLPITIGRGGEQIVFLPDLRVALQHAEITTAAAGRFLLRTRSVSGVRVNDQLVQNTLIKPGDTIRIGDSLIHVSTRENYDLVLEVETRRLLRDIDEHIQTRAQLSLSDTKLNMRRLSLWSFFSILLLFFALPLTYIYLADWYQPWVSDIEEYLSTDEEYVELPAMPKLLTDNFWNSGEVAAAHHFFREDCTTCHQTPFEPVQDKACVACHDKTHPHVDPEFFELDRFNDRCAICHIEHNGKHALINRDDQLCSDCHKDLSEQGVNTTLEDARDFGEQHPAFKPTLTSHIDGQDISKRVAMDDEVRYMEQSNLEHPHDVHLSRKGLETIDGIYRLWCDDCHTLEPGGAGFKPINFEQHCQECHKLSFEPMELDRVVPHGEVGEVLYTILDYYSTQALRGNYRNDFDVPEIVQIERFPDEELEGEERMIALNWAREKAEEVAEEVFEFSVCVECHQVEKVQESPPKWRIIPIRINSDWLPRARYSHIKHQTMNCTSCHLAQESNNSSEILLPDIETCRNCHGGVHDDSRLQSTCVDCHGFHVAKEFSMGKDKEAEEASLP
ncbi:FHA domain-containing protein [Candidatus Venteria ishoeyi]|uniref:FHA domain-containing protein n=1 Tax=Candidatus Venteria ishoeyi TaxID=1899563 RepID=UPI0025A4FB70|nr:FHA domain-containing protein [Candidatus Venteria ishoeyi]MDM8546289.1 FHA domain-containing protein [Candidatus Venteria ishoeyi]